MLNTVTQNPWVRAMALVAGLVIVFLVAYLLRAVLVPLLIAFLVAYVLDPVIDFFERRKIRRTIGIAIVGAVFLLVIASFPLYILPSMIVEARELTQAADTRGEDADDGWLANMVAQVEDTLPLREFVIAMGWVEPLPEDMTEPAPEEEVEEARPPEEAEAEDAEGAGASVETSEDDAEIFVATAAKEYPPFDPMDVIAEKVAYYVEQNAVDLLRQNAPRIAGTGQTVGLGIGRVFTIISQNIVNFIVFVANVALFGFVAVYLLVDFDSVLKTGGDLIPPRYREKTFSVFREIDSQLRAFLRGQFLVMLCLGIMYAVGFAISGTPFGIMIGILGGLASFVPYLGLVVTIVPAVALTLLQYGVDWHIVGVIITFAVAQGLEGNVLTPKIVGDQVGLGPVWIILAVLAFSSTFGFIGLLIAVPVAAALKVLVLEMVSYYKRSAVYEGGDSSA